MNKLMRSYLIILYIGFITVLIVMLTNAQISESEIIVEDADYVSINAAEHSLEIIDVASNVSPRVVLEYAGSIHKYNLHASENLVYKASVVKHRIIVEYADSVLSGNLERPFITTAVGVERSFKESTFTETAIVQNATMDNASVGGDLDGTLDFTHYEIINISTGPFTGKGFSKGEWEATLESVSYKGIWEGIIFHKSSENKIYLKGTVSGDLSGIVEGFLTESIPESGIYDQYQATWKISKIFGKTYSATININGSMTYQNNFTFPSVGFCALQSCIEAASNGHYNGPLSMVLTHLRVINGTYNGEGLSIISYTSTFGDGEGWTFDKLISPGVIKMKGLFSSPLYGIVYAMLDETVTPRSIQMSLERVDLGLPPTADLKARIWGFERVSPGQTVTYTVELRNDGLKNAENVSLTLYLPYHIKYSSSSEGGLYIARSNKVVWHFACILPKKFRLLTVTGVVEWGLPEGTAIQPIVSVLEKEIEVRIDPTVVITDTVLEATENYLKIRRHVSNQSVSENLCIELYVESVAEKIDPVFQYIEENGEVTVNFEYAIEGGSWEKIWGFIKGSKTAYDIYKTVEDYKDIQKDYLKMEDFLRWLWINDYISEDQYEYFSRGYKAKSIFEFAGPNSLKHIRGLGPYYSELTKIAMEGMNPIFKRELFKAMYLHSLEGGSFTEDSFEEVFEKYLKENSLEVSSTQSRVVVARDPNLKYGPERYVSRGQLLNYTIEYENEGEGIAFGVYITDTLDENLNGSTLEIGPVISKINGSIIAEPGIYDPATKTITWFVGEVGPSEGGIINFSIRVKNDVPDGTKIVNFATVHFPSVPETTRTNTIVSVVGKPNVAIENVTLPEVILQQGSITCIIVTVKNEGYLAETINLTLYANAEIIGTQNVTILGGSNKTVVFPWNTTEFHIGKYAIKAYVSPVPEETDTSDNLFELSPIQVIPEFPSTIILHLLMILSAIALIFTKKKTTRNLKT